MRLHPPSLRHAVPVVLAAALALGGLTACGDDGSSSSSGTTAVPGTTTPVEVGVVATGAWARSSPMVAEAGAAYMTLTNTTSEDAELVGASVPAAVAAAAEVHETSMGDGGMMSMQQVPSVTVPADGSVELAPGGFHIMLLQLAEPLVAGEDIPITLSFADGDEVMVVATVRDA
ncbi:MAG: copper chaperone PCu(A)C [Acidimicrobiales bacterium]|jgi:copper(I)-binding protein|nr:copper chaperone PCu(A)C [Acidimicrobiales bacterium]